MFCGVPVGDGGVDSGGEGVYADIVVEADRVVDLLLSVVHFVDGVDEVREGGGVEG